MTASPPDTNTVCPARLGLDEPWMTAEVSFGDRSLVVQPLDVDAGAVWIPYEDVTALDEVGVDQRGAGDHSATTREVEAVMRDGRTLALRLDDDRLDLLVAALGASRTPVDSEPAKPAMFGFGDVTTTTARTTGPGPERVVDLRDAPSSPAPAPQRPAKPSGGGSPSISDRRRWLLIGLAATVVIVILVAGLVDLLGGGDTVAVPDEPTGTPSTEATADPPGAGSDAAESTTVPTTVPPLSVSSLRVGVIDVQLGGDAAAPSIYVSFDLENAADQPIVAYRLELAVGDPATNGAAEWVVPLECSSVPLDPGVPLSGNYEPGATAANAPQLANCSVAGWPVDPSNAQQAAVAAALDQGVDVRSSVAVVSVTFADGTTVDADSVD